MFSDLQKCIISTMKRVDVFIILLSPVCFLLMDMTQLSMSSPVTSQMADHGNATEAAEAHSKTSPRSGSGSPLERVDLDSYLKNKRAMQLQIKCVVYDGPCDIVGKEVKKHIISGLTGTCKNCSSRLTTSVEKVANYIQENYPQAWYDAIYRYLVVPTLGESTAKPTEDSNSTSTEPSTSES